jgi:hypothetical protein
MSCVFDSPMLTDGSQVTRKLCITTFGVLAPYRRHGIGQCNSSLFVCHAFLLLGCWKSYHPQVSPVSPTFVHLKNQSHDLIISFSKSLKIKHDKFSEINVPPPPPMGVCVWASPPIKSMTLRKKIGDHHAHLPPEKDFPVYLCQKYRVVQKFVE